MFYLIATAAFVGFVHSLAPGHWLPVVLVTRAHHWNRRTAILGAITVASGHILISLTLGLIGVKLGHDLFSRHEETLEKYSGLALAAFGLFYAALSYFRHSTCHGHTHHGPEPKDNSRPFLFLFTLGFTPCVAVIPTFLAATPFGAFSVGITMLSFVLGVLGALIGSVLLVSMGIMKLDHPVFEHYGDVITGGGVALLGLALFLVS